MAPMLSKLVNKVCSSAAACKYYLHTGLEEKLRHLSKEVDNINDDLKSRARSKDVVVVNEDLLQLKDAIHDAEELLNMLNDQAKSANKANILKTIIGNRKSVKKVDELLSDLQKIPSKLQFLTPQAPQRRPGTTGKTALGPEMVEFYGYGGEYGALLSSLVQQQQEEEDAQVVGWLGSVGISSMLGHIHSLLKAVLWQQHCPPSQPTIDSSSSPPARYQVVAIIGYGGVGKTELARWAFYRDQDVMANFGIRIWVCVYAKFTETDLLRAICESASTSGATAAAEDDDDDDDDEVKTIERLQEQLTDILKKKPDSRYLLVLDDVCNYESAAATELMSRSKTWDVVLAPFKQHGARGSRILITTRAGICATTLEAGVRIVLDGIHADAMELLIQKKAGGKQGEAPLWLKDPSFHRALGDNVNKLHGSPLAAQEVGTNLGNTSIHPSTNA
ncbi:hypothetical protein U9M48_030955 [Paspalum notatum var. saurae]|uniref:NB-ARC domain-containing protein n=1 Tax=Paspalum notatum var. saurae TaxID=547442 RepID=A0AAQ3U413_PASNO